MTAKRHHVTQAEQDAVLWYALEVMKCLGMPTWQIAIMDDPPTDEDTGAAIKPLDGRHFAQVWLSNDWMKFDDATRRYMITHEVLHLLHARVNDVLDDAADFMHDHEWKQLEKRYRREMELLVDHLAMFMEETFKLQDAWVDAHKPKKASRP